MESTTLATVAYDEAQELLQLEFCGRAVYRYFGVPPTVDQALLGAPSKGRDFNQNIRGRFPYQLVLNSDTVPHDAEMPAKCHREEVYYVIALALYMRSSYREALRCLLEGVQWLLNPSAKVKVAGKSGISQARSRLGAEPLQKLYDAVVAPIAEKRTKGVWYRQWRLVSLDGSTLDVADTAENDKAFGRPGSSRGSSPFPCG